MGRFISSPRAFFHRRVRSPKFREIVAYLWVEGAIFFLIFFEWIKPHYYFPGFEMLCGILLAWGMTIILDKEGPILRATFGLLSALCIYYDLVSMSWMPFIAAVVLAGTATWLLLEMTRKVGD